MVSLCLTSAHTSTATLLLKVQEVSESVCPWCSGVSWCPMGAAPRPRASSTQIHLKCYAVSFALAWIQGEKQNQTKQDIADVVMAAHRGLSLVLVLSCLQKHYQYLCEGNRISFGHLLLKGAEGLHAALPQCQEWGGLPCQQLLLASHVKVPGKTWLGAQGCQLVCVPILNTDTYFWNPN